MCDYDNACTQYINHTFLPAAHSASTPNVTPAPSIADVQTALEIEEGDAKELDVSLN